MKSNKMFSAFLGVTVWGLTFIYIKKLLDYMNPMEIIFWRYLFASIIFLSIAYIKNREFSLKKSDLKKIIFTSTFGIGVYSILLNVSVSMISSSHAGVLNGGIPVFAVMFDTIARKNKLTKNKVFALLISLSGIIVISLTKNADSNGFNIGYLIMVIALIFFVMYSFMTEGLIEKYDSMELLGYQSLIGAISVVPINLVYTGRMISSSMLFEADVITNMALLVGGCTVLSYYLYLKGIEDLGVSTMTFFLNMVPISALIGGSIFMKEEITLNAMVGLVLILTSVKIATAKDKKSVSAEYT
jgi:drug/metabolite transporter (DMT)-like permease